MTIDPNLNLKNIPVVIFCGGRLVSFNNQKSSLLKGLVQIQGQSLLERIIRHYHSYQTRRFLLSAGSHLNELEELSSDLKKKLAIDIQVSDTGPNTKTGNRLTKIEPLLKDFENFSVTYSDTYSNVDLSKVFCEHIKSRKLATLVAVHVPTRFRILGMRPGENIIRGFATKPVIQNDWINGGFYFFKKEVFSPPYLQSHTSDLVLEESVLESLARDTQLQAYTHEGLWQPLDSERDLEILNQIVKP